jgi:hypothetical protein
LKKQGPKKAPKTVADGGKKAGYFFPDDGCYSHEKSVYYFVKTGQAMRTHKVQKIDAVLKSLLQNKKWRQGLLAAKLSLMWPELVGPDIAARAVPKRIYQGTLEIHCDHDVWRTELQYLKPELLKRIAEGMGEGVVKDIFLK